MGTSKFSSMKLNRCTKRFTAKTKTIGLFVMTLLANVMSPDVNTTLIKIAISHFILYTGRQEVTLFTGRYATQSQTIS